MDPHQPEMLASLPGKLQLGRCLYIKGNAGRKNKLVFSTCVSLYTQYIYWIDDRFSAWPKIRTGPKLNPFCPRIGPVLHRSAPPSLPLPPHGGQRNIIMWSALRIYIILFHIIHIMGIPIICTHIMYPRKTKISHQTIDSLETVDSYIYIYFVGVYIYTSYI